jgi:uncharacterized protein
VAVLPDINVLLPLVYDGHTHHSMAAAWLNSIKKEGEIILCRITQFGLLRLLNNSAAMGADAQSGKEAWKAWDALTADQRFCFAAEPDGFEAQFRALSRTLTLQPKRCQDAALAAFALAADAELVTFDSGFRTFPGLKHHILSPEATSA